MLEACEEEGLEGLELSSGIPFAPDILQQAQAAANRKLRLLVHNYFPPPHEPFVLNLASPDRVTLEASLNLCRQAIDLSAHLGAPFYSVHSGFAMRLSADQLGQPEAQAGLSKDRLIDRADAEKIFRNSVGELSAHAKSRGIGLLLENNVVTAKQVAAGRAETLLMTSPQEMRTFVDDLQDANVGILLDAGHAKVAAGALGFAEEDCFRVLGEKVRGVHLSDNDGIADSNRPFSEGAWFAPFLRDLREAPAVIEVYRLDAESRRRQCEILQSMLS
jgi:sugar phosphate isomerase/epimerase